MLIFLALLIGVVAGLRTMTALFAVAVGSWLNILPVAGTPLGWLGYGWAPWLLGVMAAAELAMDKTTFIPDRTSFFAFGGRLISGVVSGAAVGIAATAWLPGLGLGLVGAVVGTLAGFHLRSRAAARLGRDLPGALTEDVISAGLALVVVIGAAQVG